ncbi:hypothetical protein OED52_17550 [Rhodococcus sp. Z13]|uniref:Uncharacterized protein n=1 Tax=Rhodococcus sacchari TaxID=2962047 RepID=A0ACD4DEL3_9NOCA|nr:hypothetical protein [Rhodococcus sp. Z13]UYP18442.1 hypothetical protein OED52_17550 [Rhodococcus sp. Z13]
MRDDLIHRTDALARGHGPAQIRTSVRRGEWVRLTSGVYLPRTLYDATDDHGRHAYRAVASVCVSSPDAAISHVSAAVLHGLRPWGLPLDDVHLTYPRTSGGKRTPGRVMHAARLDETDVVEKCGVRVVGVARTVVDVAASESFEHAVVLGDRALRQGLLTRDELERVVARMGSHPGRARARRAVAAMSERSDSVGESRSRVLMIRERLPLPLEQVDVFDANDRWLARVDFLWPELGVLGEFDGRIKYRRDGVATADAEDVVYREKLREDRLRHAGWVVLRWTWADLETPGALASKFRDAVALAQRGSGPVGRYVVRGLPTQK